jgi:16S rRNA C1402 (ribose-2'-O) methylase RsmI
VLVGVEPRDEAKNALLRTEHLNVFLPSSGSFELSPGGAAAVKRLLRVLKASRVALPPEGRPAPTEWLPESVAPEPSDATLWLVPGHLGDVADLSIRAVRLLARAEIVMVESGKVELTKELLEQLHVTPASTRWVGLPASDAEIGAVLDEMTTARADACLFGVDEGVPGFIDPGAGVVAAAMRHVPPIRVRTVGGSSVLGLALMRVGEHIERFDFLGHVDEPGRREQALFARIAAMDQPDLPVVFFSTAAWVAAASDRLCAVLAPQKARLVLTHDLTRPEEGVVTWEVGEPFPKLADRSPLVAFVFPRTGP